MLRHVSTIEKRRVYAVVLKKRIFRVRVRVRVRVFCECCEDLAHYKRRNSHKSIRYIQGHTNPHHKGRQATSRNSSGYLVVITEFVKAKVKNWSLELEQLASIANTQPHAAFSVLTHGLASRWVYVARTIPNIGHLLQPLEELLRTKFIPSLTGRAAPSDLERELLALPARLGGLGLLNPSHLSTTEYSASMKVTQPLVDHIIKQD